MQVYTSVMMMQRYLSRMKEWKKLLMALEVWKYVMTLILSVFLSCFSLIFSEKKKTAFWHFCKQQFGLFVTATCFLYEIFLLKELLRLERIKSNSWKGTSNIKLPNHSKNLIYLCFNRGHWCVLSWTQENGDELILIIQDLYYY